MSEFLKRNFYATDLLTHLMARNHNNDDDEYYDNHQGKDTDQNQSNMPSH